MPFLLNSTTPNPYIFFGYETILTLKLIMVCVEKSLSVFIYDFLCCCCYCSFVFFAVMSMLVEDLQVQLTVVYGLIHLLLFWHMFTERSFIVRATLGDI